MKMVRTNIQSASIQFTSQILALITFVVFTPIYLKNWTSSEYRTWLLLIIIFQILEIFDLGIITGTVNRLSRALSESTEAAENFIKETTKALICIDLYIGAIIGLGFTVYLIAISMDNLIPICLVFLINSIINHWFGFVLNLSRVIDDQRKSFIFAGIYAFLQSCFWALGAHLEKSLLFSSTLGLLSCAALLIIAVFFLVNHEIRTLIAQSMLRFPKIYALIPSIRAANFSFLLNTLVSLISVHGYAVIVSLFVNASLFISYSILKTISRILISSSIALGNGYWSSFAKLKSQSLSVKSMAVSLIKIAFVVIFFETMMIAFFTRIFLEGWSGNKVAYSPPLMFLLLIYSAIGGFAYILKYIFFGINLEKFVVRATFATVLFGLLTSICLGFMHGLYGVVYGQIISELVLLIVLIYRLRTALLRGPVD
jgi:O-antigen/teichoic acid export membrane protein